MKRVYVDYNVVSSLISSNKDDERVAITERLNLLRNNGYRFAFSAWHSFEIARSTNTGHITSCCEFIEALDPVWMSDTFFVKRAELLNYQRTLELAHGEVSPVKAINETLALMSATYGVLDFTEETLLGMVQLLKKDPGELVSKVASHTLDAIKIGREAYKDGRYKTSGPLIDEAFISMFLDDKYKSNVKALLKDQKALFRACPSIGIEDALTSIRVMEQFKPEIGDAADMQHAVVGFGYCDYFVSYDKMLVDHLGKVKKLLNLNCIPVMNFDWPLDSH